MTLNSRKTNIGTQNGNWIYRLLTQHSNVLTMMFNIIDTFFWSWTLSDV